MSRTRLTDVEAVAVLIPCDYCLADSGRWCKVAHGRTEGAWAVFLHDARSRPAWELRSGSFREGYVDALEAARRDILEKLPGDANYRALLPHLNQLDKWRNLWSH